jgi:hypothetical protein
MELVRVESPHIFRALSNDMNICLHHWEDSQFVDFVSSELLLHRMKSIPATNQLGNRLWLHMAVHCMLEVLSTHHHKGDHREQHANAHVGVAICDLNRKICCKMSSRPKLSKHNQQPCQ